MRGPPFCLLLRTVQAVVQLLVPRPLWTHLLSVRMCRSGANLCGRVMMTPPVGSVAWLALRSLIVPNSMVGLVHLVGVFLGSRALMCSMCLPCLQLQALL